MFAEVDTPAVLVDKSIALANIAAFQRYGDKHGLKLRPHIKTHKIPAFARAQIDAGAVGITCQKISEAEVMAAHGIGDILLSYNLIGALKLQRLKKLAARVERLAVVADGIEVIDGIKATFAETTAAAPTVLVECDTGGARCGVQSPQQAATLGAHIVSAGLRFAGLMTYPAPDCGARVQQFMVEAKECLRRLDIACPIISGGGSPNMWSAHEVPVVNEYRAGTYIYNDRSLVERGVCRHSDCALTVLSTVVSTPHPERAVIDAGSKSLSSDLLGLSGHGHIADHPELHILNLSEEHGVLVHRNGGTVGLTVGQRLRIIPNHCCVVSNLSDSVVLHRNGEDIEQVPVTARGCVL